MVFLSAGNGCGNIMFPIKSSSLSRIFIQGLIIMTFSLSKLVVLLNAKHNGVLSP